MMAGSAKVAALAVGVSAALGLTAAVALGGLALFAAGEALSAWRFGRAVRRNTVPSPSRVTAAVTRARIRAPVITVEDAAPFAVTVGLLRPRVIISTALVGSLTAAEVAAVLSHEDAHARDLHPLRALGWESLRRAFFFLPSLADATEHFALVREIHADRHAVAQRGQRSLASAMLKAASGYLQVPMVAAAPFGHLPSRIAALSGKDGTDLFISSGRTAATAAAAAVILGINFLLANAAMAVEQPAGRCEAPTGQVVTSIVFAPNYSLLVPPVTPAPAGNDMTKNVPVQSTPVRP
jgi:beta-lactamase regulating signal transducer with metallopeptidase domain